MTEQRTELAHFIVSTILATTREALDHMLDERISDESIPEIARAYTKHMRVYLQGLEKKATKGVSAST